MAILFGMVLAFFISTLMAAEEEFFMGLVAGSLMTIILSILWNYI